MVPLPQLQRKDHFLSTESNKRNFQWQSLIHLIIFTKHLLCARHWGHSTENKSWGVSF